MKKKILSLILAVLLIVPAMFMLSACAPSVVEVSTYDEIITALQGNSDIIKLKNDISSTSSIYVTRKVTLDLNGKTLIGNGCDGVVCVEVTGDLTIKGDGKVVAVGGYDVDEIFDENSDEATLEEKEFAMAVWAKGGKVVIENGTFLQQKRKADDQYDMIYASSIYDKNTGEVVGEGSVTILGGKFESVTPKWTLNLKDDSQAKMIVKGGEFVDYNPADSKTEPDGVSANFVAEGYESQLIEGTTNYKVVKSAK